jgi:hypothetical protein
MEDLRRENQLKYQGSKRDKDAPKNAFQGMSLLKWITTKRILIMSLHRGLPRPFEPKALKSHTEQEDTQTAVTKKSPGDVGRTR